MQWEADIDQTHLEIKYAGQAGYYLYAWKNGNGLRDDLRDTLEQAMSVAFKYYQVPHSVWRQVQ